MIRFGTCIISILRTTVRELIEDSRRCMFWALLEFRSRHTFADMANYSMLCKPMPIECGYLYFFYKVRRMRSGWLLNTSEYLPTPAPPGFAPAPIGETQHRQSPVPGQAWSKVDA